MAPLAALPARSVSRRFATITTSIHPEWNATLIACAADLASPLRQDGFEGFALFKFQIVRLEARLPR